MHRPLLYWIPTALVAFVLGAAGLSCLTAPPEVVETMGRLGFPPWFPRWIGLWKVLGAAVLVAPGLARPKEWAYAGVGLLLASAIVAHGASGEPLAALPPACVLGLAGLSWATRPAGRRLA